MNHPFRLFLVGVSIAILSKDGSARGPFGDKFLGPHKLLLEIDMAVSNAKGWKSISARCRHVPST